MAQHYNGVVPGPRLWCIKAIRSSSIMTNDRRDAGYDPHARRPRNSGGDGRRRAASRSRSCRAAATTSIASSPTQPGTFMYHIARQRSDVGFRIVRRDYRRAVASAARRTEPRARLPRDDLRLANPERGRESLTLNGKEYPATRALDVKRGERFRIRWISIYRRRLHTMHTHGHYQQIIARDAQPVD